MKKILLLSLCALLLTLLLVGCTGGDDPQVTTEGLTTEEEVTPVPTEEETTESPTSDETETLPAEETTPETEEVTTDYFEANRIETVKPDTTRVPDATVTGLGYDLYQLPENLSWGYRYGVTYLYNDDGSVDAYFACVGVNGEWDWISYRRSPDGGETWSNEKIVLTPTKGSMDHFSNCDPGVVYFNGYYYLGYTSTLNETGTCNNVFVARSKNPDGPFEKWNGSGWGGYEPQPIFYYDESYGSFGMGEPSFVELNGTLYIYYTNIAPSGDYTMVATADATNENWPATIRNHGMAVKKQTDSLDIKYVEEWGKFVGLATGSRMGPSSYLAFYESNDGLRFELVDAVREGTMTHLHNAGLSSRRNGHIKLAEDADKLCVVYAYGEGWGTWNTRVQPLKLTLSEGNDLTAERSKPCLKLDFVRGKEISKVDRYVAKIRPEKDVYTYPLSHGDFTPRINKYDTYFNMSVLKKGTDGVTFKVHDESVCRVDNDTWKVTLVGVGTTAVEVWYNDLCFLFHVCVTEEAEKKGSATQPVELTPVCDTYVIYLGERSLYKPQLRAQMTWGDGSFTEYYVSDSQDNDMTFTGYDTSIISVSSRGVVTALKDGQTEVTLSAKGMTCKVKVVVSLKPEDGFFLLTNFKELDYENLDFSDPATMAAIASSNGSTLTYDAGESALKTVVTGGDPLFYLSHGNSTTVLQAEDYKTLEITYKCPSEVSAKAVNLQVFYCTGEFRNPSPAYQTMVRVDKDGEYHTISIDLTAISNWKGSIHNIRVDFFDQCEVGDYMFIKSIRLIRK